MKTPTINLSAVGRPAILFVVAALFVAAIVVSSGTTATIQDPTCAPPPSEIVSCYAMEDSVSDTVDGNNPSATNALSFSAGKVGQGINFGPGGYIDIPHSSNLANQRVTLRVG